MGAERVTVGEDKCNIWVMIRVTDGIYCKGATDGLKGERVAK